MYKVTINLDERQFRMFEKLMKASGGDPYRIVQAAEVSHLLSAAVGVQDDEDLDEVRVDFKKLEATGKLTRMRHDA